jgi:hypothetical protein
MSSRLPLAEIVHTMAGRTRLRIEARRGDDAFFASIATGLSSLQGVGHVDVRALTSSVLIRHHAPWAQVAEAAARARLFVLDGAAVRQAYDRTQALDARAIAAIGLGAFALFQLVQGRVLPPAITLAFYAASLGGLLRGGPEASER